MKHRVFGAMALAFATASAAMAQTSLVDPEFNRCINKATDVYDDAVSLCEDTHSVPRQLSDCRTKASKRLTQAKADCAKASQRRADAMARETARAAERSKRN